jgi:hypothetical protein
MCNQMYIYIYTYMDTCILIEFLYACHTSGSSEEWKPLTMKKDMKAFTMVTIKLQHLHILVMTQLLVIRSY